MSCRKSLPSEQMIRYIYHLSDIHVRLFTRHEEYRHVFDQVYAMIRDHSHTHEGVVVITGDILHNKIDLTPECCTLVYEFIKNLGSICPVFFIAGNHDALLNNRQRMDSLSAIFHDRMPSNAYYLRETGVFSYENILFLVNSVLDEEDWILPSDVERTDDQILVSLYHGQVGTWHNHHGFHTTSSERSLQDFHGADLVLLGDIHKHQYMDGSTTVAYAGSLISQNFSETDDDHGVLVWDCLSKSSYLHRIHNPYAHKEILLHEDGGCQMDGQMVGLEDLLLPAKSSLKVTLTDACRKPFLRLQQLYPHIRFHTCYVDKNTHSSPVPTIQDTDLIRHYCQSHSCEEFSTEICNFLHDWVSTTEEATDWKLIRIRFDDMFGYGHGNEISFTAFHTNSVVGIFGPNSVGKSTLIDILLFMLFGRISRSVYGNSIPREVIHDQASSCYGELEIGIGGVHYIIIKRCKRQKSGKIRVDQDLLEVSASGVRRKLTEEQRRKTDKLILQKVGSLDSFLFTNVMLQQKEKSFREMTQAVKKDFLYHLLRLDILDGLKKEKEQIAKDLKAQISILDKMSTEAPSETILHDLSSQIQHTQQQLGTISQCLHTYETQEKQLLLQIIPLPNPPKEDQYLHSSLQKDIQQLEILREDYNKICAELSSMDSSVVDPVLKERFPDYQQWQQERARVNQLIQSYDWVKTEWGRCEQEIKICQEDMPAVGQTVFCPDDDFLPTQRTFLDNSESLQIRIQELHPLVAWFEDQTLTPTQVRAILQEYRELEARCHSLVQAIEQEKTIGYNPSCHQCMSNPHYLTQQLQQEEWEQCMGLLKQKESTYQQCIDYDNKYEKAQSATLEAYKLQKELSATLHTRQWIEQQQALRKRDRLLHKIKTLQQSPLRVQLQETEDLLRLVPQYEQMDRYWAGNQCASQRNKTDLEESIQEVQKKVDQWKHEIRMAGVYKKNAKHNKSLQEQLVHIQSKWKDYKMAYDNQSQTLSNLQHEWDKMQQRHKEAEERELLRATLVTQKHAVEKLLKVLDRDGLPLYLLSHYIKIMEEEMNRVVSPFIQKRLVFSIDNRDIVFGMCGEEGHVSGFLGGMEAFIVDMAVKICLGKFGKMPRSEVFVIDEGISVLDQERTANLNQVLEFLLLSHRNIFLMSHLPNAKDFVSHRIDISKTNGRSHLTISI